MLRYPSGRSTRTDRAGADGSRMASKLSKVKAASKKAVKKPAPKAPPVAKVGVAKPKTAAERQARLEKILAGLDRMYPNVTCALNHSNPWELLVATILSAQCTDVRVNMVTPGLFRQYPTIRDLASA